METPRGWRLSKSRGKRSGQQRSGQQEGPAGGGRPPEGQCGHISLCCSGPVSLSMAGVQLCLGGHQEPNQPVLGKQGQGYLGKAWPKGLSRLRLVPPSSSPRTCWQEGPPAPKPTEKP